MPTGLSGSVVTVNGTRFRAVNDKALSVGEASRMTASGVDIDGAGTGAASKDGSNLELSQTIIRDARVAAMMAYIKKPEYGPAHIEASEITITGPTPAARVERGNSVTLDGRPVSAESVDVDQLYNTVMRKGQR